MSCRRDYSHLPRVEVIWDFPGGGYCCPQCGVPFTGLGDHVAEQLDLEVRVRVLAHCRRRYRRACRCPVPAAVMASGPPKVVGKGFLSNGFIALLLTERYVVGRSQNSLVTGPGPVEPRPPGATAGQPGTASTRKSSPAEQFKPAP